MTETDRLKKKRQTRATLAPKICFGMLADGDKEDDTPNSRANSVRHSDNVDKLNFSNSAISAASRPNSDKHLSPRDVKDSGKDLAKLIESDSSEQLSRNIKKFEMDMKDGEDQLSGSCELESSEFETSENLSQDEDTSKVESEESDNWGMESIMSQLPGVKVNGERTELPQFNIETGQVIGANVLLQAVKNFSKPSYNACSLYTRRKKTYLIEFSKASFMNVISNIEHRIQTEKLDILKNLQPFNVF